MRSPQLLLLSGIGPKEHLESKGIKAVLDLRGVGANFHDHVGFSLNLTINRPDTFDNNVLVANEYLQNQTGPMSTVSEFFFAGRGCTNKTTTDSPDVLIIIIASSASCAPGEIGTLRSNGKREINIWVSNIHPKSRGTYLLHPDAENFQRGDCYQIFELCSFFSLSKCFLWLFYVYFRKMR